MPLSNKGVSVKMLKIITKISAGVAGRVLFDLLREFRLSFFA